ncbi:T9SS type A sorting domain-containing protein [Chryseobacterium terrae]|uniref:T9SS type A sorting domain-containing protein n=1 Tax=Chryseobacterium terrae TaxID=3163299 RepID=A0ABW8Y023_9FLAO
MKRKLQFLGLLAASLFYGQQVTIGSGTRVDSNVGLSTPISIYYGYSLTQQIYLASEIGGAMTIQQLKFYVQNPISSLSNTGQLDVWIAHTSAVGFQNTVSSTGAGWLPVSSQQQVLTNGEVTFSGNEVTVTLATPFVYNGTDNIVITFDENKPGDNGSSYPFYQTVDFANDMSLINRSDSVNPSPTNPPLNYTGPSSTATTEVQAKKYKPVVTLIGQNLGVSEVRTVGDVVLSPNPTTDFISFKTKMEIQSVEIFDIGGRLMNSQILKDEKIDVRHFSAGVYTVKINYKNGLSTTTKIIKK